MQSRLLIIGSGEKEEEEKNFGIAFRLLKGMPRSVGSHGGSPELSLGDSPEVSLGGCWGLALGLASPRELLGVGDHG